MTKIFILIEAGEMIDDTTNFYYISVGSSSSQIRAKSKIAQICSEKNYYFKVRDAVSTDFLAKVFKSIPDHRQVIKVGVSEMWKHFRNNTRPCLTQTQVTNNNYLLSRIDINFRVRRYALRKT